MNTRIDTRPVDFLKPQQAVLVFLAFAFAYFLSTLIRAITATLAPTLVQEFDLTAGNLGLLAGGYFFGFALTQLPLGTLLDRFGPQRVVLGFLSIAVLACIAFANATGFVGLLLGRMLCGVGVSACLMAPLTGYRRWYAPGLQMRANSWMLMTGALGMVASTLPVQWLMPVVGWRGIFLGLGALLAVSMVLIAWQVPSKMMKQDPTQGEGVQAIEPPGYGAVWSNAYFRSLAPFGFVGYGGMVAMQTLWAAPWMVKVAGMTPEQAGSGMFWLNVSMMVAYLLWGWANPWLAQKGLSANTLMKRGLPISLVMVAVLVLSADYVGEASVIVWTVYCVSSTVAALAQPAIGMAFKTELAGRALSAFNLVIFSGVFAVQWGVGLVIDALRAWGWAEPAAYQGAIGVYGLCCLWAYVHFLRAKTP